jgi:hypothetical protein
LAAGAPSLDNGRGKAYVWCGGPQGLEARPCWERAGEHAGDHFADRVGQAGDVNGDGYDDLFVAIPSWEAGPGRCELYLGGPAGLAARPAWAVTPPGHVREQFGDCTHPTGDVNGDGYDDLLVGAYQALSSAGRALLYLGGPRGLALRPAWVGRGEAEGDQFGYTLSAAGDVDGDGRGDVLLGAKFHDSSVEAGLAPKSIPASGKAYLYRGAPAGLEGPIWTGVGEEANAQFSVRAYALGDMDGDGRGELMLSEPGADGGAGRIRILDALTRAEKGRLSGRDLGVTDFGRSAGPAGDVNGDGYADLIAAGRKADEGRVWIWFGGPAGYSRQPQIRVKPASEKAGWGAWVAPAGDLDGDGLSDVVISAELESVAGELAGRIYVLYGRQVAPGVRPTGWSSAILDAYLPRKRRKAK